MIGKQVAEEGTTQGLSLFRNAISAPFRDALIAFMAATAQAQAEATKETQRAGIAHAKANGDEGPARAASGPTAASSSRMRRPCSGSHQALGKPASSGGTYAGARWFIVPPALPPTTALPVNLDTVQERVKDATACRSPSSLAICWRCARNRSTPGSTNYDFPSKETEAEPMTRLCVSTGEGVPRGLNAVRGK